jgi:hypothetical protein
LFEIPGTTDPLPQPSQEPVFTNPLHLSTQSSPVTFEWNPCNDENAEFTRFEVENLVTDEELPEEKSPCGSTGLPAPLALGTGLWEANLWFATDYTSLNSDNIEVEVIKYSESEYQFTVE